MGGRLGDVVRVERLFAGHRRGKGLGRRMDWDILASSTYVYNDITIHSDITHRGLAALS